MPVRSNPGNALPTRNDFPLLETINAVSVNSVEFDLSAHNDFDDFFITLNVTSPSDSTMSIRFRISGSIITTLYSYHTHEGRDSSVSYFGDAADTGTNILLTLGNMTIHNRTITVSNVLSSTSPASITHNGFVKNSVLSGFWQEGGGSNDNIGTLEGIQINSNLALTGSFHLYGYKR